MYDEDLSQEARLQMMGLEGLEFSHVSVAELLAKPAADQDFTRHEQTIALAMAGDPIIVDDTWLDGSADPQGAIDDGPVTVLEDIIVTGPDPDDEDEDEDSGWYPDNPIPNPDGGEPSTGTGTGDSGPGAGGGGVAEPGVPPVSDDGQPASIAAAQELKKAVEAADKEIEAIPNDRVFTLPDGRTITGAEIKAIWNAMSFHVTDGPAYGLDRAGKNENGAVSIDATQLNYYAGYTDGRLNYLVFHEVAHQTQSGQAYNLHFWNAYVARTGDTAGLGYNSSAPEFVSNERYSNEIARIMSTGTLLPMRSAPSHGYLGAHDDQNHPDQVSIVSSCDLG